jgi:hypothetical protein
MRILLATIALGVLPPSVHPWPVGVGPRYHPAAPVRDGRPVGSLVCGRAPVRTAVHVELFAARRVMIVPAGIGRGPGCSYPLSTAAPTGVVRVRTPATLGDLFRVWGRELAPGRLLSFRGRVHAFVAGRPVGGDPRAIRLAPHAQVVLEVGGYVAPHPSYLFPKGTP